jgi:starch-binding outer membrane protein SusE/F
VLDLTTIEAPQLTAPSEGGNYTLLQADADNILFRVNWNAADYQMTNVMGARYAIEVDKAGNNFSSPATLATIDSLSYDVTVTRLNDALGVLGLLPDQQASVSMRVRAFIPDAAAKLTTYSNAINFNATPYKFKVRPIYMLGSGTRVGWSNTTAIEMEHVEGATYTIVENLTGGANMFIKFISVRGQWAPQWGTTAAAPTTSNGVTTGALSYRPTESVSDPAAIPVPSTGTYRITADTIGLTYKLELIEARSEKVFGTGNVIEESNIEEMDQAGIVKTTELNGSATRTLQPVNRRDAKSNPWVSASHADTAKARLSVAWKSFKL